MVRSEVALTPIACCSAAKGDLWAGNIFNVTGVEDAMPASRLASAAAS